MTLSVAIVAAAFLALLLADTQHRAHARSDRRRAARLRARINDYSGR